MMFLMPLISGLMQGQEDSKQENMGQVNKQNDANGAQSLQALSGQGDQGMQQMKTAMGNADQNNPSQGTAGLPGHPAAGQSQQNFQMNGSIDQQQPGAMQSAFGQTQVGQLYNSLFGGQGMFPPVRQAQPVNPQSQQQNPMQVPQQGQNPNLMALMQS